VYNHTYELICFAAKGTSNIYKSNVKRFPPLNSKTKEKKEHPTQKPTALISELITDCTKEGDLILDCFGGSCTTAVSAIYNKRNFICFEQDEKYVEIGEQRVEEARKIYDAPSIELPSNELFIKNDN